jgi:cytochrome c-type biogenesis protein CcmF
MIHTFIGNLGHAFIIVSFVAALVATYAYFQVSRSGELEAASWRRFARGAFLVHGLSVLGVVASLFFIIYNHYFEYHYAWSHSSRSLPAYYMISCFWEGQEGSFLLWIFWHVLLGFFLMRSGKTWEAPTMAVFALVQAFLVSMILGVVIPGLDFKIGSSPFVLLREALPQEAIFRTDPNFVPLDGNGLNPLLQNYWMVIHPPTLFLGFAATLIPFAFCIAGLWKRDFSGWIRPALPWALFMVLVLGAGIMMGAVWAYETLNFGGYWNWDPVENAVYIPWLVMVGAIHTMVAHKKNGTALKPAIMLTIASFILILYATFLTRSGILGNASVHSFTDLGLSGQLLVYLLAFVAISVAFVAANWKKIPSTEKEVSTYSREFWIFTGVTIVCLSAFQVLYTTSIPVYNKVVELLGFVSNIAPPADQIAHYTKIQLWFGIGIVIATVAGQYFWWKKPQNFKALFNELTGPFMAAMLISAAVIAVTKIDNLIYIVLLTASVFAVAANGKILWNVVRNNHRLSGGALSHIGVALMLIGILYSAGYSKVVSLNTSGLLISNDETFTKNNNKENKENTLLWLNEPTPMDEYFVTYRGRRIEARDVPGYFRPELVAATDLPYRAVAKADIVQDGKTYFKKGDTLEVSAENSYYEIEYRDKQGRVFTLYPRAQINEKMGNGLLSSPDTRHDLTRDLYVYVNSTPDPRAEPTWSKTEELTAHIGDTLYLNDYVSILENVSRVTQVPDVELGPNDAAVKARIRILGKSQEYVAEPVFMIKDHMVGRVPETVADLGVKVTFMNVDPQKGTFTFGVNTTQKDYVIVKAMEKPLINLLWLGTLVVLTGVGLAMVRRYGDSSKMREKEQEPELEQVTATA